MDNKTILYHPCVYGEAELLAEKIEAELGTISWKYFDDKYPNIFIEQVKRQVRNRDLIFVADFSQLDLVIEQLAVNYSLPRYLSRSLTTRIMGLPKNYSVPSHGTKVYLGDAILQFLALTPSTRTGPPNFCYQGFDPVNKIVKERLKYKYEGADNLKYAYYQEDLAMLHIKNGPPVIFAAPNRTKMAVSLAEKLGAKVGDIVNVINEKENYLSVSVKDEAPAFQDVIFLASFDTPHACIEQLAIIYHLATLQINSLKVVLPFFPVGTMERIIKEGDIATAKTLSRLLSGIPLIRGRIPTEVIIYDLHNEASLFNVDDDVLVDHQTAIPLLLKEISKLPNVAIAYPDDGAYKRFGKALSEWPEIICNKVRLEAPILIDGKETDKIVTIKQGNPVGKHVIILDDLAMTCGTLLECRKALIKAGATEVSAAFIHGVFPHKSYQKLTKDLFTYVWVTDTNSIPAEGAAHSMDNFEMISIEPHLCELLK